jgi:hypothetical protein
MKQTLKSFANFFAILFDVPSGSRLEAYINMRNPKSHSDVDRIIREYYELRMW